MAGMEPQRQVVLAFLQGIIKGIVDFPDQLHIEMSPLSLSMSLTVFTVRGPKSDIGKIIGKSGRNVQAIRTLLVAIGAKVGVRSVLQIDCDDTTAKNRRQSDNFRQPSLS